LNQQYTATEIKATTKETAITITTGIYQLVGYCTGGYGSGSPLVPYNGELHPYPITN
jgi:hypothetical protein